MEGEAGSEPADRQKRKPRRDGDDGDQPGDAPHLQLERARLRLHPFRERGDPPELGLHPGRVDERGRLTRDDCGAAEDQVTRLKQLPAPRFLACGAQHRLRLTRQRREVDVKRPLNQPRVRGDSFTLLDEQYVAGNELGRVHEHTLAVPANRGLLRQVRTQRLDRALGLALLRKGEGGVEDDHRQHREPEHRRPARERKRRRQEEQQRQRVRELARELRGPVCPATPRELVRTVRDQPPGSLARGQPPRLRAKVAEEHLDRPLHVTRPRKRINRLRHQPDRPTSVAASHRQKAAVHSRGNPRWTARQCALG